MEPCPVITHIKRFILPPADENWFGTRRSSIEDVPCAATELADCIWLRKIEGLAPKECHWQKWGG